MQLFSPSNRALTRADIRLIDRKRVMVPALVAALVAGLGFFAGGVFLGTALVQGHPEPLTQAGGQRGAEESFTIDRVGVLVGRLRALESDVLSLRKMLDEQQSLTRQISDLDPSLLPEWAPSPSQGDGAAQGGPWLPPLGCTNAEQTASLSPLDDLRQGEAVARCLRQELDRLMDGVAERNATLMAIPSWRPVSAQVRLNSNFGNRVDPFKRTLAFHSGVDFAAPSGSDVFAAAGGRVTYAGRRGGYGVLVEIDHGNGLVTRYAHLSRHQVRRGHVVTPGQRIGAVGSTGRSTGPHLHFEVLRDGRFVDPQRFLALSALDQASDADALAVR